MSQTLKIRYFDPRLNTWVDKWTDTVTLPRLVQWRSGAQITPRRGKRSFALASTPL